MTENANRRVNHEKHRRRRVRNVIRREIVFILLEEVVNVHIMHGRTANAQRKQIGEKARETLPLGATAKSELHRRRLLRQ